MGKNIYTHLKLRSSPILQGGSDQDPQRMPKAADSTEPYMYSKPSPNIVQRFLETSTLSKTMCNETSLIIG